MELPNGHGQIGTLPRPEPARHAGQPRSASPHVLSVYDGSPEADLLLLEWWTRMAATEDLEKTFSAAHASVGNLFESFRPPSILLYEADDLGIWFAAWFDPVMSGAFYGLWIAPHKRVTRAAMQAVQESVAFGLEKFPVLIGAMREAKVAKQAERLGARILGELPGVFDGETAIIAYITPETVRARQRGNHSPEVSNG